MFAIKYFIGTVIPDVPTRVSERILRQRHLVEKLLENSPEAAAPARTEDEAKFTVQNPYK